MNPQLNQKVIKIFSNPQAAVTCGACSSGEHHIPGISTGYTQGCCHQCGTSNGYLGQHYSPQDIAQIKKDFNFLPTNPEQTHDIKYSNGFWDKEKGCKLPRDIRSAICTTCICPQLRNALAISPEEHNDLIKKVGNSQWGNQRKYKP